MRQRIERVDVGVINLGHYPLEGSNMILSTPLVLNTDDMIKCDKDIIICVWSDGSWALEEYYDEALRFKGEALYRIQVPADADEHTIEQCVLYSESAISHDPLGDAPTPF